MLHLACFALKNFLKSQYLLFDISIFLIIIYYCHSSYTKKSFNTICIYYCKLTFIRNNTTKSEPFFNKSRSISTYSLEASNSRIQQNQEIYVNCNNHRFKTIFANTKVIVKCYKHIILILPNYKKL